VSILDLFDKETGAKLRAGLAVVLAVATFVVAILQAVIDNLGILPQWEQLGAIAMWIQGSITFLGRFTALGDQIQN